MTSFNAKKNTNNIDRMSWRLFGHTRCENSLLCHRAFSLKRIKHLHKKAVENEK